MLIQKYKKAVVLTVLILISFVFMIYAEDNNEIDIDEIKQVNPFAQFAGEQTPDTALQGPKPELFVETVTLKFLNAKSLKTSITNMSSGYGSMEPDAKGNSLIICDTQENLKKILAQIRKADRKPDQIMIEVVLLDVRLNDETEIGISWDMLTTRDHDAVFRQNLGFSATDRLYSTIKSDATVGAATAFNTNGTGSDLWLLWPGDIRNVIHALQKKNDVEILASPRVMVVSGKEATIEAVEEIPYQEVSHTSEGGTLTSVQFKNVGVKLNVGATLTDDKFILLNVKTEQNFYTGELSSVPTVDTRKIESSLLLEDGQILVIGGLRRKETQKQTNQIPILGDLPIVGWAFKATDTVQKNSELLIILSPHIYNGERPTNAEMQKFNEITQRPLLALPKGDPNGVEEKIGKGIEKLFKPSADEEKVKDKKEKAAEKQLK